MPERADAPDDLDRLFARLSPIEPPGDFAARVGALTYAQPTASRRVRVRRRWLALDLAALALLAILSVSLGMELRAGGALDLASVFLIGLDEIGLGLGEAIELIAISVPWVQLGLVLVDVGLIAVLSRLALAAPESPSTRATG